jgi:metal-responsive CopG/Arc/MetJ family transcriptional regulator
MTKRNVAMAKENLSVTLPSKLRSLVEKEAKRGKRSRSAIVSDALQLYFRLRPTKNAPLLPKENLLMSRENSSR